MHDNADILVTMLIFLASAVIFVPLFKWMKASTVLGYLAAGLLIGPEVLGLVRDTGNISTLAHLGVVFLLFTLGLELSFERLRSIRSYVFGLGTLQVALTGGIFGFMAWYGGMSVNASIIVGGALAFSSTAFVMQLLQERSEQTTKPGRISFSILLLQDIAVVFFLALLPIMAQDEIELNAALLQAVGSGVFALMAILVAGRFVLRPIYRMIASTRSQEIFVATTLLIVLGVGWIMEHVGLSMALGAFLCGLMLAETEYRHQIDADIHPFKGLLMGLFFMTVGMSIDLDAMKAEWLVLIQLVFVLVSVKVAIITTLGLIYKLSYGVALRVGLILAQGGEFAFVLLGQGLNLNLIDGPMVQLILGAVLISMVFTPMLFHLGELAQTYLDRADSPEGMSASVHDEISDVEKHVIIAGFGRVGQSVAKMLGSVNIPYIALDLDLNRVNQCRAKGMSVYYGDASRLQLLEDAGAERARAIIITIDQPAIANRIIRELRENFKNVPLLVRARDRRHAASLEVDGAHAVVPDTAEASLQLGGLLMKTLGVSSDETTRVLNDFRREDYAALDDVILGRDR